jgi:hypothetical protein
VAQENQCTTMAMAAALLGLLAGCAAAPAINTEDIPAQLRVSAPDVLARQTRGVGAQIYQCRADKDDAARFAWQLKAPEADLFDPAGHKIGKHYGGPTWEASDGSKVIGEVVARADSPDPHAVPWLLLRAKSVSGEGIFSGVGFIQRLHTAGGNAPMEGCNQGSAGSEARVSYSADYWFYAAKR